MGRKTQPKASYVPYAIDLNRMIEALSLDTGADPRWVRETSDLLRQAVSKLLSRKPKAA